jgi:tetratricopeptide (TPR) repeat protein/transcriptional regulator with XRE-family HTH domain
MTEQPRPGFADVLRLLREDARLTQAELAEAAGLSFRTVSDLERGVNRTARKATASLLADSLGLTGPVRDRFLAAALGRISAAEVLAARTGALAAAELTAGRYSLSPSAAGLTGGDGKPERIGEATAGSSALLGRDRELALLIGLIEEAAAGRGCSVLVEGEPGIGKSALCRAALAQALKLGCQVFWGAGDELGQLLPLAPFLDALAVRGPSENPRRNTIVGLLRAEVAADRNTDVSAALVEQLLALVAEQCAVQPVILVIDDLQWADQASIALWVRLARMAQQAPLLLIGVMRPVPQRHDLLALGHLVDNRARLHLTGLAEPAVAEFVAALAGGTPDTDLLQLAEGASGNPLYLVELVAALARSSGLTVTAAGTAVLTTSSAPGSLSAAIADRLGFVSPPVHHMLRAAALLGVDFAVHDLAIVLGRSVTALIPAIDEASAAGVLAEAGSTLGFRHPLIWAALYDGIPAPVRAAWHLDAGRALAKSGTPADRVARQLLQAVGEPGSATQPMDEWVLTWLARTADQLVGQAPEAAAQLLSRAVATATADPGQRDRLATRLADAFFRVGDTAAAVQLATRVLEHVAEPDLLVDLHCTLAQCRMLAGEAGEVLATLNRALTTPEISAQHRTRLLVLVARTHCHLGDMEKAGSVAASALEAASEEGDKWVMGWALHVLTLVASAQGKMSDVVPLFDRALAVTQADPALTDLRLLLQINKSVTLGDLDQYEEALTVARQARHLASQVGTMIRLAQAHSALGQLLFETGKWDDALAEVGVMHETLQEPAGACTDLGIAAVISFHRGDISTARRHLRAAEPYANQIGRRLVGSLTLARSLDRELEGALCEALAILTNGFGDNSEELEEIEDMLPDAVRLAIQTGDLDTARDLGGQIAALATDPVAPHRQANALYSAGLLDHDVVRLLMAAKLYGDASRPLLSAKALEAAAGVSVRVGDRHQARAAFIRAADIYSSLGAATDLARLRAAVDAISCAS